MTQQLALPWYDILTSLCHGKWNESMSTRTANMRINAGLQSSMQIFELCCPTWTPWLMARLRRNISTISRCGSFRHLPNKSRSSTNLRATIFISLTRKRGQPLKCSMALPTE